jgi:hypothetical protein
MFPQKLEDEYFSWTFFNIDSSKDITIAQRVVQMT